MFSRRALLACAPLAATAAGSSASAEAAKRRFVLVHGAWHGAFCWRPLQRHLEHLGHEVHALTLTGLAERAHLLDKRVGLSTHVRDVASFIEVEELQKVTLVGHSYGGLVITGASTLVAERIERLVYLDAFVPAVGQSGYDLMPKFAAKWQERVRTNGDGWLIRPMLDAKAMGIDDPKQATWLNRKLTPQPSLTFEEKVVYEEPTWRALPKVYLRCARYPGFGPTAERVATMGFAVRSLDCGHDAMLAAPEALASALA